MKTKNLRTKIKNFLCVALVVIALLLSSNFSLAYSAIRGIRNMAHAEYKPTDTVSPYEFTTTNGWDKRTNATTNSDLLNAFNSSTVSFDLTKTDSELTRPSKKYNGDDVPPAEGQSSEIDNFAMTLQAKNAPTKITVDKKDKDGNVLYEKDKNGNFVYEDRIYSQSEVEGQDMADFDVVDPTAETKTYKKKTYTLNEDGSKNYKKDDDDNFIYEDKVYTKDEISGSSDAFDQIEDTGTYNKRVAQQEENANSYYGYRTTSSITLRANSFYVFTFWVWTQGTKASFVINKGTTYDTEMEIADTNGEWVKYYLFFEADSNSSSSVYLTFYFGSKDKLTAGEEETVNGAIFVDNVCVRTISQTDYNTITITGDKPEDKPENAVTQKVSMRDDISINALKPSFEDFNAETDVYDKMYKDADYASLASHYNKDYTGEDIQAFEKFVSRYTDDNGNEEMANEQIAQLKRAYRDYFKLEVVEEAKTFQVDDLDEDGNVKKDEDDKPLKKDGFSTFNENNKILKLENKSEAHQLGLLSAPIIIKQFGYYRLSLYIKADDKDAKAVIKLTSNLITGDSGEKGKMQVKSQSVDAFTDESEMTNDWKEVVFYIQGNCFYDWYMQLVILADTESTIYVDNIRLENITSDTYRNQSSTYRFDLAPTSVEPSSKIENGYFNSITTSEVNREKALKNIPFTPYGWSKLDNNTAGVVAGIVSTNETLFTQNVYQDENGSEISVQNKLGAVEVPITKKTFFEGADNTVEMPRTNVLAIYSPSLNKLSEADRNKIAESKFKGHYYGYKSSQFSLSSNSVYEVSFEVFFAKGLTGDSDGAFEGTLFANLIYSDKHVAEFETKIEKETTQTGVWQKYTFFVRTGSSSRTFYLELGVKDAFGTAFFQNVDYKTYEEKDNPTDSEDKITVDEQYDAKVKEFNTLELQDTNKARFVDFDRSPTQMVSSQKVEDKDYYSSLSHQLRTSDRDDKELIQGDLGVIDTSKEFKLTDTRTFEADALANPNGTSKFAMMIYNSEKYNTVVYPNTKTSLSSSSYYEISLYVRTIDVDKDHGLTITIDNISVRFDKVNTQDGTFKAKNDANGYTKLTALVKTGSSTISGVSINYELGTESDKTTGIALISDISIKKLADEDEYNELVEAVSEDDATTIVKDFMVPTNDSDADDDADNLTLATFFLVFSSILLVAVLIFAVVAVYVKKIPKKAAVATPTDSNKDNTPKDGFV